MTAELEDAVFRAPPKGFTAARDALAAALKASGRTAEAKEVKTWRRPTVPVWLWNRLILDGDEAAKGALEVAATLAEAIAGRSDAGGQLPQVIAALRSAGAQVVSRGAEVAAEVDVGFSTAQERELADLVQALPWSDEARQLAQKGRLREPPPPVDPLEAMRVLATGVAPPVPKPEVEEKPDAKREAEAHKARVALAEAEAALATAQRVTERARAAVARAEQRLDEAQKEVAQAEHQEAACQEAVGRARDRIL